MLSALQALLDRGLTLADADCLEDAVPKPRLVSSEDATVLWSARHQLFKSRSVAGHDRQQGCLPGRQYAEGLRSLKKRGVTCLSGRRSSLAGLGIHVMLPIDLVQTWLMCN
ncbi:hypothetical protein A8B84_20465 [Marinobacter sp. EhC06]|nr:hypothetical protein A8B84_20465 [Marinobacter sp. EhC06]OAN93091.1 hypothetical protein A8B80_17780 [Marinobacter sp. EhN04]